MAFSVFFALFEKVFLEKGKKDLAVWNGSRYLCATKPKRKMKAYNAFKDKHGNQYGFSNYLDFAQFWFNIPYAYAQKSFPDFKALQRAAANSKEARTKI